MRQFFSQFRDLTRSQWAILMWVAMICATPILPFLIDTPLRPSQATSMFLLPLLLVSFWLFYCLAND